MTCVISESRLLGTPFYRRRPEWLSGLVWAQTATGFTSAWLRAHTHHPSAAWLPDTGPICHFSPPHTEVALFILLVPSSLGHKCMVHSHRHTDLYALPHSRGAPSCSHTPPCHCVLIPAGFLHTRSLTAPTHMHVHVHMLPNSTPPVSQTQGTGLARKPQKAGFGMSILLCKRKQLPISPRESWVALFTAEVGRPRPSLGIM